MCTFHLYAKERIIYTLFDNVVGYWTRVDCRYPVSALVLSSRSTSPYLLQCVSAFRYKIKKKKILRPLRFVALVRYGVRFVPFCETPDMRVLGCGDFTLGCEFEKKTLEWCEHHSNVCTSTAQRGADLLFHTHTACRMSLHERQNNTINRPPKKKKR